MATTENKPILCLDFDGVIHSYTSGWKGADKIPDPIVPGTIEFLIEAGQHLDIYIFSSRSHQEGGIEAMKGYLFSKYCEWLDNHPHADDMMSPTYFIECLKFPLNKPPALVSIDDRTLQFTGEWPSIQDILSFKPWNKKGV